ncbi:Glycosyltransferase involved in cell wall bisynthesis [Sphingopyxis terrae subsp. ummariensis]|uniref:Glycosyltransferase involved in cell wall bisynthesis n=2 Tax=Sphingopyxis terrae TaxID=33052 RepID=A0A1Y6FUI0_9SPHN|nr:Glycosyltransferase involved in cell wall bisynthesis [Sphingopyxis terrae subsp. ummariensis]
MLAPIAWRTPPRHYGPWEEVTSLLTEALVARGIDVTLFATADSLTAGRLEAAVASGYSETPGADAKLCEYRHLAHLFAHADRFDLIHNQADFPAHAFAPLIEAPMVTTIHGFSSERILPMYEPYNDRVHFVAISDANRHPALRYAATIHHGIDLERFRFREEPGERLLFFGRIHPDKGTAEAIALAQATDLGLDIYGIVQDSDYFDQAVAPHIDGAQIRFHGPAGGLEREQALAGAKALVHLINFDEPFGLSVIEAMACGTPTIAIRRGSMPEIIDHRATGILVDDVAEAITAMGALFAIDRRAVRHCAERRFSAERMAAAYVRLYTDILAGRLKLAAGDLHAE